MLYGAKEEKGMWDRKIARPATGEYIKGLRSPRDQWRARHWRAWNFELRSLLSNEAGSYYFPPMYLLYFSFSTYQPLVHVLLDNNFYLPTAHTYTGCPIHFFQLI